jgi:cobalamin biosynthesis Mg chelatase CobN
VPESPAEEVTEPAATTRATEATEAPAETTAETTEPAGDSTEEPPTEEPLFQIEPVPNETLEQTEETQAPEISRTAVQRTMSWLLILLVVLAGILLIVIICLIKCFP